MPADSFAKVSGLSLKVRRQIETGITSHFYFRAAFVYSSLRLDETGCGWSELYSVLELTEDRPTSSSILHKEMTQKHFISSTELTKNYIPIFVSRILSNMFSHSKCSVICQDLI